MKKFILVLTVMPLIAACSSIILKPVNFGWPIEDVLTSDDKGIVEEKRHSIIFNATPLYQAEFGDSTKADSKEIRIIRNSEGYYFITAQGFKYVYVFDSGESMLELENKFLTSLEGLQNPVFNQRNAYIELIDGNNIYELTAKGITKR